MKRMTSRLCVNNITKDYPIPGGTLNVLKRCSFSLQSSESLAVVGPSGSGKSTFLAILGSLEPPTEGTVVLNDQEITSLSPNEIVAFRRRSLGVLFQEHYLLPQCSSLENVLLPILAERRVTRADREIAESLLERVGLKDRFLRLPAELSGGERQRVALVRAIIRKPQLLLADEPTGSLDRDNADSVARLLFDLARDQATILILATHDSSIAERATRKLSLGSS